MILQALPLPSSPFSPTHLLLSQPPSSHHPSSFLKEFFVRGVVTAVASRRVSQKMKHVAFYIMAKNVAAAKKQ